MATAPDTGCIYIISHVKRWNVKTKRYEMFPLACHKLCEPNSNLCPRHALVSKAKPPAKETSYY